MKRDDELRLLHYVHDFYERHAAKWPTVKQAAHGLRWNMNRVSCAAEESPEMLVRNGQLAALRVATM